MASKIKCTCGHSWNKSDSSKKDMHTCHVCGKDNVMENGGWLSKYEEGGVVQENYNDSDVSLSEGFVGMGNDTTGRHYSPAWKGQFEDGGIVPIAQRGKKVDKILNQNKHIDWVQGLYDKDYGSIQIPGQEGRSTHFMESADNRVYPTVRKVDGELQYLGDDAYDYADSTKSYIEFPTDKKAQKFAKNYKRGTGVLDFQQGGSIPGSVGFTYARTAGSAPSEGKYAKKTLPSAQNGQEMKFYQEGLDWKPKSMQTGGTERISINDPRYPELYKNRQVGSYYDGAFTLPDLDQVTVTAPRSYTMQSLRDATSAALYGAPANVMKLSSVPQAAMTEGIEMLRGRPYDFGNVNPNFGGFSSNQRDPSVTMGYENPEGFLQNAANIGLSMIDPSLISGLTRRPIQKGLRQVGQNLKNVRMSVPSEIAEGLQTNGIFDIFKAKPKFQSEIDWSKWNPDTPNYPELINEYNVIEESTKKSGTWMTNPDGSAFQGTPEQFVQQQSSWFKKAFGESKLISPEGSPMFLYHGSSKKFDTFDPSKFQLGDAGYSGAGIYTTPSKTTANSYATSSAKFHSGDIEPTVYQLYGQGNRPIKSSDLIKENQGRDLFNFHRDRNWKGELSPYESLREYDVAVSDQLPNVQNIRPLYDAREIVFPTNTQLKSAIGNVGFFDMSNPNIYKGVIPAGIATGLSLDQKRDGGIVKDNQGYWNPDNWGKPVEIDSNNITMQGVYEPLIGISDTGDTKLMTPGNDYKFKGSKVTEIPVAKLGINQLDAQPKKKLNQLLNFTNNPDKTNWLDKYQ